MGRQQGLRMEWQQGEAKNKFSATVLRTQHGGWAAKPGQLAARAVNHPARAAPGHQVRQLAGVRDQPLNGRDGEGQRAVAHVGREQQRLAPRDLRVLPPGYISLIWIILQGGK